ncbi:zinc finger protein 143 [Pitangus sulphuratus]|nr:zinc finger protein 143 [Pitangus sulphuratus]
MTEFSGGGMEAQHVTLCLTEAVAVQDGDNLENMEGVSLQAVTLADGSTAYIQHNSKDGKLMDGQVIQLEDGSAAYVQHVPMPKSRDSLRLEDGQAVQLEDGTTAFIHHTSKDSYDQSALQAVQLEDGTTAYIHHTVQMPQSDTILAIQADGTVAGLHTGDAAIDPDTISALEQYAAKVSIDGNDSVSGTGMIGENEQDKKMQGHVFMGNFNDFSISWKGITAGHMKSRRILEFRGGNWQSKAGYRAAGKIVLQGHGTRVTAKSQQTGEKAFRCDYDGCGKLYTTAHHLKVHERSHTGDRPYQCEHPGCGKAFATGYGLKSHVRTHTGEKPYRCTEENCTKSFKTSGDLQKHIRTHTDLKGQGFGVLVVDLVWCSQWNVLVQGWEKPYVCTVPGCDKRFTEYSSLYKHHVVHTHSKPYNCNHCGKTYKQISTLAMHKRTAHNDTEPIEEEQEAFFEPPPGQGEDVLKGSQITYVTGVEGEDVISAQVATVTQSGLGQQVALISQDGTQHVNISQADMQAIGNTITMVTQDGTTITVPAHDAVISSAGTHSVAMVTAEGTEGQQVAIVAQDLAAFHSASSEMGHQQHGHHLVTTETRPVTLLATSNGTQIAVQLGEQQSLEEAIRIASRIQQGETPGIDD